MKKKLIAFLLIASMVLPSNMNVRAVSDENAAENTEEVTIEESEDIQEDEGIEEGGIAEAAGASGEGETAGGGGTTEGGETTGEGGTTEGGETTGGGGTTEGGETTGEGGTTERGETSEEGGTTEGGEATGEGGTTEGGETSEEGGTTEGGETTGEGGTTEGEETTEGGENVLPEDGAEETVPPDTEEFPPEWVNFGIYPGAEEEQDGKKVWVAYDAPYEKTQPADATIKIVVSLPDEAAVEEGYRLFIRKVSVGEGFYPKPDAVKEKASAYNDYQCYVIRWIKESDQADVWDTKSISQILESTDGTASVKIEYLNQEEGTALKGPAGGRKLLIFNSTEEGGLQDTIADLVTDVRVGKDAYQSFTFQTAQAGPYVFVSKKLEKGYIQNVTIGEIIDGSEPFDKTDTPGNDSGEKNRIVRSYDTIQYNLGVTFAARQNEVTQDRIKMFFELTLGKSATAARFDTSKMLWLGENYCVEYLDAGGQTVMIQSHDGKFYEPVKNEDGSIYRDENGFAQPDKNKTVLMNAQVNGSTAGPDSYKVTSGGITQQKLTGWTELTAAEGGNVLTGTQTFSAAVEVRNADNGEVFSPSFKLWLEGNEDNYGSESTENNEMVPATPVTDNVAIADGDKAVTVSAGTNFNLQVKKNTDMSYKNWFDFSTGGLVEENTRKRLTELARLDENHGKSNPAEFVDENGNELSDTLKAEYANYRYGRITCYGITLQLYNDTDNEPGKNRASKGLKGFSLPVGDITFDLNFSSNATSGGGSFTGSDKEYTAILWDYNENVNAIESYTKEYVDPGRGTVTTPNDGKGNGGRNLYWDYEMRSPYAKGGAPSNYMAYFDGCYYGGDWKLTGVSTNDITETQKFNQVVNPKVVTGTGADATYHFSISDYDFDFDGHHFPKQDAGNSGTTTGYDTYARCFSAGCVQVLSVFPMVQEQSVVDISLNATVSNLNLTTRAGQKLEPKADDSTKIKHEVNKDDNTRNDKIVVYAPGSLTKGSSFNGKWKDHPPNTTVEGFLGTDYWTTSYDCSAFAGDDIWLVSYGMMGSGGDYRTRAMNLLQLFDSRALSIREEPYVNQTELEKGNGNTKGKVTFLYAADPDYPEGYDTNGRTKDGKDTMLAYMNTVREEDLVYSTDMPDEDGYITVGGKRQKCVGVLMEIRECNILGGIYQYFRIPVRVNGEDKDLVGKTVATVNTFRVWTDAKDIKNPDGSPVTWADGVWNETTGKNELKNYTPITGAVGDDDHYTGELANGGSKTYVKTEYKDGLQVTGTHQGGTLAGNSLLILSYEAHINVGVDNKNDTGALTYNQGNGETVVDYRLKNIKTELSATTGQDVRPKTTLTIRAVLDAGHVGEQRISISNGTYRMMGRRVGADGKPVGEKEELSISSDKDHPTELFYTASDGKEYKISVYAVPAADGREISFVIGDAPVGLELPDITFQANFASVNALENNDTIKADVYISGEGDNRAYDTAKGNEDNVTVGVVINSGTNLSKAVQMKQIELNGTIIYDVTYENSGSSVIPKIYFYDLLPDTYDIRDSEFDGEILLRKFDMSTKGGNSTTPLTATIYYSTTEYGKLYDAVKVFGGKEENGKITGMNADNVEKMLEPDPNSTDEPLFSVLGRVGADGKIEYDSSFKSMSDDDITELMEKVTGLYAKVENLNQGQSITMTITIETNGNKAGDQYKNIANSWIAGSDTLPLTSNKVETVALARRISGLVWYDRNANGIRETGEPLLEGVTATLFKKDDGTGKYVECKKKVTGELIESVTTGTDGAYTFDELAAGDYIVAFYGDGLKAYTGAGPYQKNGNNDNNTNDGVKNSQGTPAPDGIDTSAYGYFIQYSLNSPDINLHSIADIGTKNIRLNNFVEDLEHQDLGLVNTGDLVIGKTVGGEGGDKEQEFTFTVELKDKKDKTPLEGTFSYVGGTTDSSDATLTPPADGTINFSNGRGTVKLKHGQTITIKDLPAEYSYTVTENKVSINPDKENEYETTVKVNDGEYQKGMKASGEIEKNVEQSVAFHNERDLARGDLKISKKVDGKKANLEKAFSFTITLSGAAGKEFAYTKKSSTGTETSGNLPFATLNPPADGSGQATVELKNGETITISGIPVDTEYTIQETGAGGYDTSVTTGTGTTNGATVTGTIGKKEETVEAAYTNTYDPTPVEVTVPVKKEVEGAYTVKENDFSFTLAPKTGNPEEDPVKQTLTVSNGADGSASFGPLEYTLPGTYTYTVKEVKGKISGIIYDEAEYKVTVEVMDDGNGKLKADVTKQEKSETAASAVDDTNKIVFTNKAVGGLTVSKTVEGKTTERAFTFTIHLTDHTGNDLTGDYTCTRTGKPASRGFFQQVKTAVLSLFASGQEETITFVAGEANVTLRHGESITIHGIPAGTEYKVTEEAAEGYTSAPMTGGTIPADGTITVGKTAEAAFTNTYAPTPVPVSLKARKNVTGDYTLAAGQFKFSITPAGKNPSNDPIKAGITGWDATKKALIVSNEADGNIKLLDNLEYTAPGTYVYTVKEESDNPITGVTYDSTVYTVTIAVTDPKDDGKLTAEITVKKGMEVIGDINQDTTGFVFNNTYKPEPVTFKPQVKKAVNIVNGNPDKLVEFTFEIKAETLDPADGAALSQNSEDRMVKITGNGTGSFGDITFTRAGTYTFTIAEVDERKGGYTYDTTPWTLTVTVKDNNGKLWVSDKKYTRTKGGTAETDHDKALFTNEYSVEPLKTELEFEGVKKLTGRKFKGSDSFTFELSVGTGSPIGTPLPMSGGNPVTTVTVTLDPGVKPNEGIGFHFGGANAPITYTKPGTYYYIITERHTPADAIPGITYDASEYRVTVTVTDKGDGTMAAAQTAMEKWDNTNNGWKKTDEITFINEFRAENKAVSFGADKTLEGRAMAEKEFTYILRAEGSKTHDGNYGIRTDYTEDPSHSQPMPEDMDEKTKEAAAQNAANGSVSFGEITYTVDEAGDDPAVGRDYLYSIREKQPTVDGSMDGEPLLGAWKNAQGQWVYKGVVYDTSVKYAFVHVYTREKVENGEEVQVVHADITYLNEDFTEITAPKPEFKNIYHEPAALSLPVKKVLKGRSWRKGDSFEFRLSAGDEATKKAVEEGKILLPDPSAITIDADTPNYTAEFGTIGFTAPGTWKFVVEEKAGNDKGLTYDTTKYVVQIEVVEKADGTLEVTWKDKEELVFTNVFKDTPHKPHKPDEPDEPGNPPGNPATPINSPKTGDENYLLWWLFLTGISIFGICAVFFRKKK